MEVKLLKDRIEELDMAYQIEIGRILQQNSVILNENKNGIFINLTDVNDEIINKIKDYLQYVDNQEELIENVETIKQGYKDNFFNNSSNNTILDVNE
mgnify:CR=1 FL=1